MSIEAVSWVLNAAPNLPHHCLGTAIGLANHADADGRNAWPSQARLAWYTRKSERSVRKDLAEMTRLGLIRQGNQKVVAHIPPDRRPVVYDLALELARGDAKPTTRPSGRATMGDGAGGTTVPAVVPEQRNGGNQGSTPGGTTVPAAGGTRVPTNHHLEPSKEPSKSSSSAPTTVATIPADHDDEDETERSLRIDEAAQQTIRDLTDATDVEAFQMIELMHEAREEAGKSPILNIAAYVGGARTDPAKRELLRSFLATVRTHPLRRRQSKTPEWCGRCDQRTRMKWVENYGGYTVRCSACHPNSPDRDRDPRKPFQNYEDPSVYDGWKTGPQDFDDPTGDENESWIDKRWVA